MSARGTAGRPVRCAVVGYGYAGRVFHAPLIAATPGMQLAAIVTGNPKRVAGDYPQCRVYPMDDLEACADVDVMIVATPNRAHLELGERVLQAGRHLVIDKPFALSLKDAHRLQTAARDAGLIATAFHNRRWDGDFLTVRRLIESGALGEVVLFESRFDRYRPTVRNRWREREEPGSGIWYDLGPHLVDQALLLFGAPDAVFADLATQRKPARAVDYFHVTFRYETLRVILSASSLAAQAGPRFRVLGSRATYVKSGLDPQEDALVAGHRPDKQTDWGLGAEPGLLIREESAGKRIVETPTAAGDYPAFYSALRDAIAAGAAVPVASADILVVTALLELAVQSDRERRELPVSRQFAR